MHLPGKVRELNLLLLLFLLMLPRGFTVAPGYVILKYWGHAQNRTIMEKITSDFWSRDTLLCSRQRPHYIGEI